MSLWWLLLLWLSSPFSGSLVAVQSVEVELEVCPFPFPIHSFFLIFPPSSSFRSFQLPVSSALLFFQVGVLLGVQMGVLCCWPWTVSSALLLAYQVGVLLGVLRLVGVLQGVLRLVGVLQGVLRLMGVLLGVLRLVGVLLADWWLWL